LYGASSQLAVVTPRVRAASSSMAGA
jgi:hypothetical protein